VSGETSLFEAGKGLFAITRGQQYPRYDVSSPCFIVHNTGSVVAHQGGEVTLQVPKLRKLPFETAIIERYRRSGP
jgi:hypothetical protein